MCDTGGTGAQTSAALRVDLGEGVDPFACATGGSIYISHTYCIYRRGAVPGGGWPARRHRARRDTGGGYSTGLGGNNNNY